MQLWLETWQATYPDIDFSERLDWWKQRWLNELLVVGEVIAATDDAKNLVGFVALTPATGYLDQLVVVPSLQGQGLGKLLLDYVKGRADKRVDLHVNQSNIQALNFYRSQGFKITHEAVNPNSGLPTYAMRWQKA